MANANLPTPSLTAQRLRITVDLFNTLRVCRLCCNNAALDHHGCAHALLFNEF
jgi:hypothetical protein